ncbi:putative dehydrogenase [Cricetibacter osteomyelitidis]|uniref:Putative dehydrogenase n=1 Tax=Cricetibacter osteomyelitidis TaxID=1521931 RepID=A0A4R2T5V5_9PAST|nr:Gfo/Idh/MocA family oxidoreductase [Cricetibacter osteomyelitidis]TCP97820.1 putative dehydrogenase [Cricetibacter osteomyelitidis]
MNKIINVGIAGFGMSARTFHAPFLHRDPRFQIKKVLERSTEKAKEKYDYVEIVRDFTALLTNDIDLVIITTPNPTHYPMAKQAILAGKNVIVEKPLAITAKQASELALLAKQQNVTLSVYQNRRWDNGTLTVKQIVAKNLLGEIVDYEIRFDRYAKSKNVKAWKETGEQGVGLVYDLGVHLMDQVIDLFGKPTALYADVRYQHKSALNDDNFRITFYYPDKNVVMCAGKYSRENTPHVALHGKLGSYIKQTIDNQEALLIAGTEPAGDWNVESDEHWGILHTEINDKIIRQKYPTITGNYQAYYDNIYDVLTNNGNLIVTAEQAAFVLSLIEKVYESAKCGVRIDI